MRRPKPTLLGRKLFRRSPVLRAEYVKSQAPRLRSQSPAYAVDEPEERSAQNLGLRLRCDCRLRGPALEPLLNSAGPRREAILRKIPRGAAARNARRDGPK